MQADPYSHTQARHSASQARPVLVSDLQAAVLMTCATVHCKYRELCKEGMHASKGQGRQDARKPGILWPLEANTSLYKPVRLAHAVESSTRHKIVVPPSCPVPQVDVLTCRQPRPLGGGGGCALPFAGSRCKLPIQPSSSGLPMNMECA